DLTIKYAVRIDLHSHGGLQVRRELLLRGLLGLTKPRPKRRVVRKWNQAEELTEIRYPTVANRLGHEAGELRVGQHQPAARRDPVRLIVEALGEHLGEVGDHA